MQLLVCLGIPGAGATKGTVVNINSVVRLRLSGTIHGLFY
jgi:SulP family sulfate permease